jgi:hypothetical protein
MWGGRSVAGRRPSVRVGGPSPIAGGKMAWMLMSFELNDYDEWKQVFDSDPIGRKAVAKGHRILRAADNPNAIFLGVEYPSVDDAKTFRQRLLDSGILERFPPKAGPTVVDVAEEVSY